MADNIAQDRTTNYAGGTLRAHFRTHKDTLVAVDLLVFYGEGDEEITAAPDVMVVRGVPTGLRSSYRVREDGKPPDFVLEVLSKSMHLKDEGEQRRAYARMGVREYFRYDPRGRTMARRLGGRRLIGERLVGGPYREIPQAEDGSVRSEALGLDLRVRRGETEPHWRELRFRDSATGRTCRARRRSASSEWQWCVRRTRPVGKSRPRRRRVGRRSRGRRRMRRPGGRRSDGSRTSKPS